MGIALSIANVQCRSIPNFGRRHPQSSMRSRERAAGVAVLESEIMADSEPGSSHGQTYLQLERFRPIRSSKPARSLNELLPGAMSNAARHSSAYRGRHACPQSR